MTTAAAGLAPVERQVSGYHRYRVRLFLRLFRQSPAAIAGKGGESIFVAVGM